MISANRRKENSHAIEPSFSICIPNFNYAKYIGSTIQSVLDQTYQNFEIVVVDNASTDNSVEVVQSFKSNKLHLHCNRSNVGFAPNLDRAIAKAKNDFLILLSSDDLMASSALEEYAKAISAMGDESVAALFVSSIDIIDSFGNVSGHRSRRDFFEYPDARDETKRISDAEVYDGMKLFKHLYENMLVPGAFCSTMYSRDLSESIGGYSSLNSIGPDTHFSYKALLWGAKVVFLNKPLFQYRIHQSNQLSQDRNQLTLRVPIDRYLFSVQYSDAELSKANADRLTMQKKFIDDTCLQGSFAQLRKGSWYQAFRFFAFGFSAYPVHMLGNLKTYVLGFLLILGPLGIVVANMLYAAFSMTRKQQSEYGITSST